MNKRLRQICLRMAMIVMMAVAVPFQSFAANAKIAFSDPSAEVGGTVSVTMKFTSTSGDTLGNTDVMLSYDANMLEYTGGSGNASGGAGAIRVTSGMEGKTEIVTSLEFKALQAGSTQIKVASWEGYDENGQTLTMDKEGSSSITITAPATYSTDAALQSLQISPGALNPAFSPEVENYTTTVGLDTTKLTVSALANSDKARVEVEGGNELVDGDNTVVCKVTAEDGTTVKNYTIVVTRVEGGENAVPETDAAASNLEVLAELESSKTLLKLGITALPEGVEAPTGLKESTVTIGDTKVQGWIPNVEGQPEYCVFYGVSERGIEGFYCYDRTDKTIQRYFQPAADQTADPDYVDVATKYNDLVDDYGTMKLIAIAAAVIAGILFVVLIVTMVSRRKPEDTDPEFKPERISDAKPERKPEPKPSRRTYGRKLTKEERYMMGEEDEYVEPEELPEESYSEPEPTTDMEAYQPETVTEEAAYVQAAPVEDVERTIAAKLAWEASAASAEPEESEEPEDSEEDDFEVFDLDEEGK
ncbi:MAG: cadherin-like beta sandwich domain-containing protein [Lachnospiraceae bacterium]|nr:cadherin-like beta sandwich domain-containing protein [Lachnospiraceae bacterium]